MAMFNNQLTKLLKFYQVNVTQCKPAPAHHWLGPITSVLIKVERSTSKPKPSPGHQAHIGHNLLIYVFSNYIALTANQILLSELYEYPLWYMWLWLNERHASELTTQVHPRWMESYAHQEMGKGSHTGQGQRKFSIMVGNCCG